MDKESTTLLRKTKEGNFMIAHSLDEADYIRLPIDQYVDPREWNELIDEFEFTKSELLKYKQLCLPPNSRKDTVVISKEEYHGLSKLLRIVRKRSLQQIERSTADKHGYTLRLCDEKVYDRSSHPVQMAYAVLKSTPYSLKMDLETAFFMIMKDLKEFYSFIDLSAVSTISYPQKVSIPVNDFLHAIRQKEDSNYTDDYYIVDSDYGYILKEYVDQLPNAVSFEIIKIGSNIGQGVYEVSYWCTNPV